MPLCRSAPISLFALPITASLGPPGAGAGPQDPQVIRDHAETDPPFHPVQAAIPAAPQPVAAFEDTDTAFAPGAPAQCLAEPALARRGSLLARRRASPAGQRDFLDAQLPRHPLVRGGCKPAIGTASIGCRRLLSLFGTGFEPDDGAGCNLLAATWRAGGGLRIADAFAVGC